MSRIDPSRTNVPRTTADGDCSSSFFPLKLCIKPASNIAAETHTKIPSSRRIIASSVHGFSDNMSRTYNISKPGDDGKRFVIGLHHRIWVGTLRSRNTFA